MSKKKGKRYPRDFKLNAARLVVEGGYTYAKAAERLGISIESLRRWIKAFRAKGIFQRSHHLQLSNIVIFSERLQSFG